MTNSKMTKRALLTSIMALMLCFAMLTGTTFAWFTDQETSGNNQIIAGNLDIEMYNALATEITDATAPIDATTPLFGGIKLEPGAVVYENITVANKGNLALKYQLSVNFTDGGLAKALKVAVVDGGIAAGTTREALIAQISASTTDTWTRIASFSKEGKLYLEDDANTPEVESKTATYGIVIYWEPSANDNDYNGKNKTLDIGLTLFATQLAAEKDAFDENYDKDAVVKVATADQLKEAVAAGKNVQFTADITMSEKLAITADTVIFGMGKTLTYTGADRAIDAYNDGDVDLTINDLTVNCSAGYCQRGINYNDSGDLVLNNVTIKGTNVTYALNLPGSSDNATVVINNSALTGNIALNVWGENATITANNTVFTSVDKAATENYSAIVLNNDGTSVANGTVIYVNGGKIIAHDEKGALSNAVRNGTTTGKVEISDSTEVIGNSNRPVAIVDYGTAQFYSSTTLQAAIDKAIATNGNVKLITNIVLDKPIVVDGTVAIDLNGHNITYTVPAVEQTYHAIIVKGDLTVRGKGTIALYDKSGAAFNSGIQSTAISVAGGTLTLNEGVTVLSDAGAEMAYAVDVNTTLGNSVLNVNGAELKSSYIGVRVFNNNKTGKGTVNYNSGVIDGEKKGYDIWVQNLGQPAENAVVNIADGINYTSESLSGTMYYID